MEEIKTNNADFVRRVDRMVAEFGPQLMELRETLGGRSIKVRAVPTYVQMENPDESHQWDNWFDGFKFSGANPEVLAWMERNAEVVERLLPTKVEGDWVIDLTEGAWVAVARLQYQNPEINATGVREYVMYDRQKLRYVPARQYACPY